MNFSTVAKFSFQDAVMEAEVNEAEKQPLKLPGKRKGSLFCSALYEMIFLC